MLHLVRRARRLLVPLVLLAAFLLLYALSNLTAAGQAWENHLLRAHEAFGMPAGWVDADSPIPPFVLDKATVVVGILLAVGIAAIRRRWRAFAVVAIATPIAIGATSVFKDLAPRPDLLGQTLDVDVSYPSGHAAVAFAITAALLVVVPRRHLRWIAPILLTWCVLVASVLQAIGDHRPSEVLGSGLLVAAVFGLVGAIVLPGSAVGLAPTRGRLAVWAVLVAVAVVGAWNTLPWAIALYAVVALGSVALVGRAVLGLVEADPARARASASTTAVESPESAMAPM